MRPYHLRLVAFGPYPNEISISFERVYSGGLFLIHGRTGSGKTSLLDAMTFALFGKSSSVERDKDLQGLRCDSALDTVTTEVEFIFSIGTRFYRVLRRPTQKTARARGTGTRELKAQAELYVYRDTTLDSEVGGTEGSSDGAKSKSLGDGLAATEVHLADFQSAMQRTTLREKLFQPANWQALHLKVDKVNESVEALMGMDERQFRQIVVLPQGHFRQFLSASSTERQALLEKLFQTEKYSGFETWLYEKAKRLKEEEYRADTQFKVVLNQLIESYPEHFLNGQNSKETEASIQILSREIEKKLNDVGDLRKTLENQNSKLTQRREIVSSLKRDSTQLLSTIPRWHALNAESERLHPIRAKWDQFEKLKPLIDIRSQYTREVELERKLKSEAETASRRSAELSEKLKRLETQVQEVETQRQVLGWTEDLRSQSAHLMDLSTRALGHEDSMRKSEVLLNQSRLDYQKQLGHLKLRCEQIEASVIQAHGELSSHAEWLDQELQTRKQRQTQLKANERSRWILKLQSELTDREAAQCPVCLTAHSALDLEQIKVMHSEKTLAATPGLKTKEGISSEVANWNSTQLDQISEAISALEFEQARLCDRWTEILNSLGRTSKEVASVPGLGMKWNFSNREQWTKSGKAIRIQNVSTVLDPLNQSLERFGRDLKTIDQKIQEGQLQKRSTEAAIETWQSSLNQVLQVADLIGHGHFSVPFPKPPSDSRTLTQFLADVRVWLDQIAKQDLSFQNDLNRFNHQKAALTTELSLISSQAQARSADQALATQKASSLLARIRDEFLAAGIDETPRTSQFRENLGSISNQSQHSDTTMDDVLGLLDESTLSQSESLEFQSQLKRHDQDVLALQTEIKLSSARVREALISTANHSTESAATRDQTNASAETLTDASTEDSAATLTALQSLSQDARWTKELESTLLSFSSGIHKETESVQTELRELKAQIDVQTTLSAELSVGLSLLRKASSQLTSMQRELDQLKTLTEKITSITSLFKGDRSRNLKAVPFSRFVLQMRLDQILEMANQRLKKMTRGQFVLKRAESAVKQSQAQGLSIEVEDLLTGTSRQADSLSGGESFMASLALSLGLADCVQMELGGVQLESVFVDEGFGTLDPEALDLALQSLVQAQGRGRIVGIISHVAELKEQIPHQIEVRRENSLSSERSLAWTT